MIPRANDPQTANDPQNGPEMILDRKYFAFLTASDPVKSRGTEMISGVDCECAENLNNA